MALHGLKIDKINNKMAWQDGCTPVSKLSSLGSIPDPAINCHPSVSQAG